MTIDDVAKVLNGKVLFKEEGRDRHVGAVVASDLMSDVLLVDADDMLLLTSLASDHPAPVIRRSTRTTPASSS